MPLENGFVFPLIDFAKYLHNYKSDLFWILQLEEKHVEIWIVQKIVQRSLADDTAQTFNFSTPIIVRKKGQCVQCFCRTP